MRLPHTCIHVSTHQHTYSCIHTGKHEDTHTNFINRHVHKKYYLQIYSYSWCPCPRDCSKPVINSRSISFSVATFLDHCCSLSHNEHLEQDEPAELLFPLSYWRRSISDPRVCLGELKLLFFHLHGMSPTPIKLLSLSSEIVFRYEIKNTIKSH